MSEMSLLRRAPILGILLLAAMGQGCAIHRHCAPPMPVPCELAKVSLPPYVIESPDIVLIDAIRLIPRPPYRIEPQDTLGIRVDGALPEQPIQGVYGVEADGRVNLGFDYGSIFVQGMTLEQARVAIERFLQRRLKPPFQVSVVAVESRALQQIRGPHLVQPDGTVNLGLYGSVYVDNMTIPQAKSVIEHHLSQFLLNPEISLSVAGFNSKVYYIITDGGGATGDVIQRVPVTGKTTVLDALALVGGLPFQASKKKIWVARPAPHGSGQELILPVDYQGIVKCGKVGTNYQLLPGDRLYVRADPLIEADAILARIIAPMERLIGFNLLFNSLYSSYQSILNFGAFGTGFGTGNTGFGVGIGVPVP